MRTRLQLVVGLMMELTLVGVVVGFVALGNRTLGRGLTIFVDFDRLENLKEGAEVRISALIVGRVIAIRQGATAGEPPPRARLRAQIWLERARARHVLRSSVFTINAKGPIGERYVEVGPPSGNPGPAVAAGEALRGIDSPVMDRLIQHGYDTLRFARAWERELQPDIHALVVAADSVRLHLDELKAESHLQRIQVAAKDAIGSVKELWQGIRAGTDDLRQPRHLLQSVDAIRAREADKLGALSSRAERLVRKLDILDDLLPPDTRARAERAFARLRLAASQGEQALLLAQRMRARVLGGRGTIGRMLADEEIGDEIKEAHRVLKEAPWRALGRTPENRVPRGAQRKKPKQPRTGTHDTDR